MSAESDPSSLVTSPEVPEGPPPLAGTKRSRRGTTPVDTSTPSTTTTGRKSKRLQRVPIAVPMFMDPMEGPSHPATSEASATVVPLPLATMVAVREAMLQVFADPHFTSLMQCTSTATSLPLPSMVVSNLSADITPATPTEAVTMLSKAIPVVATSANNALSSGAFRKLVSE